MTEQETSNAKSPRSAWNHNPQLPISLAPYFDWPPRPGVTARWLARMWFPITEWVIILCIATLTWFYFTPALERCREFALDWMAEVYLRNLTMLVIVAGGLHLYLYTFAKQGKKLRYEHRELAKSNRSFTFRDQVLDNMFWSLASGVTVWSAYEIVLLWGYANSFAATLQWSDNAVWFAMLFLLLSFWQAFSFILDTSPTPLAAALSDYPRYTPSQFQHRPMVRVLHASD